jgi:hypothetical protein
MQIVQDQHQLRVLELVILHAPNKDIEDIKSIRRTCKHAKNLVDPLITKLNLKYLGNDWPAYRDFAPSFVDSPLLPQIRELRMSLDWVDEDEDTLVDIDNLELRVLRKCGPRLERLSVESIRFFEASKQQLGAEYEFPVLKTLCLNEYRDDIAALNLRAMPALEMLLLAIPQDNDFDWNGGEKTLKSLADAPFLGNLVDFELSFVFNDPDDPYLDSTFDLAPDVSAVFQKTTRLKRLELVRGPIQCFNDAPLENLTRLRLCGCVDDGEVEFAGPVTDFPHSLVHLEVYTGCLEIHDEPPYDRAFTFLTSGGGLPFLKTLTMQSVKGNCRDVYDDDLHYYTTTWKAALPSLNLPSVEEISFRLCKNLVADDIFRIAAAAPNLLQLKRYTAVVTRNERVVTDSNLVAAFCASSIAANLHVLHLQVDLGEEGFAEFVNNAFSMKCLKSLAICVTGQHHIDMIAAAGSSGSWPKLRVLKLIFLVEKKPGPEMDDEELDVSVLDEVGEEDIQIEGEEVASTAELATWQEQGREAYCNQVLRPIWPGLKLQYHSW